MRVFKPAAKEARLIMLRNIFNNGVTSPTLTTQVPSGKPH